MKRFIIVAIVGSLAASHSFARIGDTPQQLQERYGPPIKQAFGSDGEGMCIYHADGFTEIRVHFSEARSDQEEFGIDVLEWSFDAKVDLVKRVQSENPQHHVENRGDRVRVLSEARLKSFSSTENGKPVESERSYSGVAKISDEFEGDVAVLNDNGIRIELPRRLWNHSTFFEAHAGHYYTVTVLPNSPEYLGAPSLVITKREHVDLADSREDAAAHGGSQQLVRITEGDKVLLDRSVCTFHHIPMEKRNAKIEYGMPPPPTKGEAYCQDHFPNYRDYALGGCVVSENSPKSTPIYICPKCVAECNEYKRQHPDQVKDRFN